MNGAPGFPRDRARALGLLRTAISLGSAGAKGLLVNSLTAADFKAHRFTVAQTDALVDQGWGALLPEKDSAEQRGYYYFGWSGRTPDYKRAVPFLEEVESEPAPYADEMLAFCYYFGRGVPKDFDKVLTFEKAAARKGSAKAAAYLKQVAVEDHASQPESGASNGSSNVNDPARAYEGANWSTLHPTTILPAPGSPAFPH